MSTSMFTYLVLFTYLVSILAASPAQWRSRSIYQIMADRFARSDQSTTAACNVANRQYCGGSWQGIIEKLDYIQDMGFTAIWLSPITANLPQKTADGTSYHGYWQQNINALNANFGTTASLKNLSSALHARGMYLMVDVVINDFGWAGTPSSVNYATFQPFNSQSYFHSYCPITSYDYSSNQTAVEDCWLGDTIVPLADVDTTQTYVINTYNTWIQNLVSTYSIDGIRVDAAEHVQQSFWSTFCAAAGVYCVGEVDDGDPSYTCPYQNYLDGVLNYPLFYPLTAAFESISGNIGALVSMVNTVKSECKDSTLLGTFLENWDNPRFPNLTSDISLTKNAISFTLLADGIPIIYEGQEQHFSGGNDPNNREALWLSGYNTAAPLYGFIASVNQLRNHAIYVGSNYTTYMAYPIYSDSSTIVMRKGFNGNQIIGVFSNRGANGGSYSLNVTAASNTGFTAAEKIVELLSCVTLTADGGGNVAVPMASGLPKVSCLMTQSLGAW
ncbi:MAG: hypothetical protein MMC33_006994 [Icmadophila ericetorum]|nr:hypothetical protein [Icmadophila ericetorum]